MKGIIFRGFLNLVEENFGIETMDAIIEESDLASGGAYTLGLRRCIYKCRDL